MTKEEVKRSGQVKREVANRAPSLADKMTTFTGERDEQDQAQHYRQTLLSRLHEATEAART